MAGTRMAGRGLQPDAAVWLVGASSGIGAALACRLLREGHPVALSSRREAAMRKVAGEAGQPAAARASIYPCDVTRPESVASAYRALAEERGVPDCVLVNAGTYAPMDGAVIDAAVCRGILDVNLYGAMAVVAQVLPDFVRRGSGIIAAVASVAGYRGLPRAAAYCASKAGLIAFVESLRFDLEPRGLRLVVVNPGFVKTRLTDKNDFHMPGLITAEKSADYIYRGLRRGTGEIHFPPAFSWFMKTLRVLPHPLFEALVRRTVRHG